MLTFKIFVQENVLPRANTASGKKKEEVDNGPLFQRNNLKHQRDIDEHKLKVCFFIENVDFESLIIEHSILFIVLLIFKFQFYIFATILSFAK